MFPIVLALIQPLTLALTSLTYLLGIGLARYLGVPLAPLPFLVGWLWITALLMGLFLLDGVYRNPAQPFRPDDSLPQRLEVRRRLLQIALALFTFAAALMVALAALHPVNLAGLAVMALILILSAAYALPPLRLTERGLGEFFLAILTADLTPALAFSLQNGSLHRLLAAFIFPLTFLALAYFLTLDFPTLARDQKFGRQTVLSRFGWQIIIPAHNGFVLAAYFLLAAAPSWGLPFALIWPGLLTLPLAAFQIYQFRSLAAGAKPYWPLFTITAAALFGLTSYLLLFTLWIR